MLGPNSLNQAEQAAVPRAIPRPRPANCYQRTLRFLVSSSICSAFRSLIHSSLPESRKRTMQSSSVRFSHHFLGLHFTSIPTKSFFPSSLFYSNFSSPSSSKNITPIQSRGKPHNHNSSPKGKHATLRVKGNKENVWSVDNELANAQKGKDGNRTTRRKPKARRVIKRKRNQSGRIMVSGAMLMEVETVLQTQVLSPPLCLFV